MALSSLALGALANAMGVSPWVFKAPLIAGKAVATGGLSLLADIPSEIGSAVAEVGTEKLLAVVSENPELLNDLKAVGENTAENFSDAGKDQAAQALARMALREDLELLIKDNT